MNELTVTASKFNLGDAVKPCQANKLEVSRNLSDLKPKTISGACGSHPGRGLRSITLANETANVRDFTSHRVIDQPSLEEWRKWRFILGYRRESGSLGCVE